MKNNKLWKNILLAMGSMSIVPIAISCSYKKPGTNDSTDPKPIQPDDNTVKPNPDNSNNNSNNGNTGGSSGNTNNGQNNKDQDSKDKEDEKTDDFAIQNITFENISSNFATMNITFSKNELANNDNKDFEIIYTNGEEKSISTNEYEAKSKSFKINLQNLEANSKVKISKILLNGKELSLSNLTLEFQTLEKEKIVPKISKMDYALEYNGTSKNIIFSFNVEDFEVEKGYNAFLKINDKQQNKDIYVSFIVSKESSSDFKNIRMEVVEEFEDEEMGTTEENFAEGPLVNKIYEVKQIILVNQQDQNDRVEINAKENSNFEFDTTNNSLTYQNLTLSDAGNNNLNVSVEFSEEIENKSVKANVVGSNGWKSSVILTKNNSLWSGSVNNIVPGATYTVSSIVVDDKIIFSYENNNNPSTAIESNLDDEKVLVESSDIQDIANKNIKKIIVKLNNNENSKFLLNHQKATLIIEDNKSQTTELTAIASNKDNLTYEFNFDDYSENNNYTIKKLLFNGFYLNIDKEFNTNVSAPKKQLNQQQLDQLVDSISSITLNKKWWATKFIEKITDLNTLLNLTDLDFKTFNIKEYDIALILNDTSWFNIDELNGQLSFKLQLSSGNATSKIKDVTINNLYSKQWISNNLNNTKLFSQYINISETGKTKSTHDFDNTYKDDQSKSNAGDLDSSLGGKSSYIIELSDPSLKEFIDIDESLMNSSKSSFKVYFVKYADEEHGFGTPRTTPYAMLGYMQYKILYWFDTNNFENKFRNQVRWLWLGGFNTKGKGLYDVLKKELDNQSENIDSFNDHFGFNKELKTPIDNLVAEFNSLSSDRQRWNKLVELTNINRLIYSVVLIAKNSYNPEIKNDSYNFNIESVSKVVLGDNQFIQFRLYITPSYPQNSANQDKSVAGNNFIDFKFLYK
ncbi:hypothetical protein AB5V95_00945 [Metamycoplasma spumans]|uniref:hypothetical protein n=1 Tax=Metamycoplasma spumans TaxID=92406 RepID=UPI0034DDB26B